MQDDSQSVAETLLLKARQRLESLADALGSTEHDVSGLRELLAHIENVRDEAHAVGLRGLAEAMSEIAESCDAASEPEAMHPSSVAVVVDAITAAQTVVQAMSLGELESSLRPDTIEALRTLRENTPTDAQEDLSIRFHRVDQTAEAQESSEPEAVAPIDPPNETLAEHDAASESAEPADGALRSRTPKFFQVQTDTAEDSADADSRASGSDENEPSSRTVKQVSFDRPTQEHAELSLGDDPLTNAYSGTDPAANDSASEPVVPNGDYEAAYDALHETLPEPEVSSESEQPAPEPAAPGSAHGDTDLNDASSESDATSGRPITDAHTSSLQQNESSVPTDDENALLESPEIFSPAEEIAGAEALSVDDDPVSESQLDEQQSFEPSNKDAELEFIAEFAPDALEELTESEAIEPAVFEPEIMESEIEHGSSLGQDLPESALIDPEPINSIASEFVDTRSVDHSIEPADEPAENDSIEELPESDAFTDPLGEEPLAENLAVASASDEDDLIRSEESAHDQSSAPDSALERADPEPESTNSGFESPINSFKDGSDDRSLFQSDEIEHGTAPAPQRESISQLVSPATFDQAVPERSRDEDQQPTLDPNKPLDPTGGALDPNMPLDPTGGAFDPNMPLDPTGGALDPSMSLDPTGGMGTIGAAAQVDGVVAEIIDDGETESWGSTPIIIDEDRAELLQFMVSDVRASVAELEPIISEAYEITARQEAADRLVTLAGDLNRVSEFFDFKTFNTLTELLREIGGGLGTVGDAQLEEICLRLRGIGSLLDQYCSGLEVGMELSWPVKTFRRRIQLLLTNNNLHEDLVTWHMGDPERVLELDRVIDGVETLPSPPSEISENVLRSSPAPTATLTESKTAGTKAPSVRVTQDVTRQLFDIARQLVLNKNQIDSIANDARTTGLSGEKAEPLALRAAEFSRLVERLQLTLNSACVQPISVALERYERMVQDVSRMKDKEVEFQLVGEDTTIDKFLLDAIADPIGQLLREAVSRSIETAADREAAGKPRLATLRVEAQDHESHVTISISHDGAHPDLDAIREEARTLEGAPTNIDAISDHDVRLMPLQSWYTSAETAGLLQVFTGHRSKVDCKIEGAFVTTQISLPVSGAVLGVMNVRVGSGIFAIPVRAIEEIVSLRDYPVQTVKGQPVLRVRDNIHPMLECARSFNEESSEDPGVAVIVNADSVSLALRVDRVIGHQEIVIEPTGLEDREAGPFLGGAILSDGSVCLVVDVRELAIQASKGYGMPSGQKCVA